MFLDAMEFRDPKNGMVIGDPVDGRFFIAKTNDAGEFMERITCGRKICCRQW